MKRKSSVTMNLDSRDIVHSIHQLNKMEYPKLLTIIAGAVLIAIALNLEGLNSLLQTLT